MRTWKSYVRLTSALSSAALLAASGLWATTAYASPGEPTTFNVAAARTFLSKYGVPPTTQNALIAKVQSGQLLDSDKPDAKPIREIRSSVGGYRVEELVFADGSITVTQVEQAAKAKIKKAGSRSIRPNASVSGCQVHYVNAYNYQKRDCHAIGQSVTLRIEFTFDFNIWKGGDPTYIKNSWTLEGVDCAGGWSPEGFTKPSAAKLRYGGFQSAGGAATTYRYLQVLISGETASATMK